MFAQDCIEDDVGDAVVGQPRPAAPLRLFLLSAVIPLSLDLRDPKVYEPSFSPPLRAGLHSVEEQHDLSAAGAVRSKGRPRRPRTYPLSVRV